MKVLFRRFNMGLYGDPDLVGLRLWNSAWIWLRLVPAENPSSEELVSSFPGDLDPNCRLRVNAKSLLVPGGAQMTVNRL